MQKFLEFKFYRRIKQNWQLHGISAWDVAQEKQKKEIGRKWFIKWIIKQEKYNAITKSWFLLRQPQSQIIIIFQLPQHYKRRHGDERYVIAPLICRDDGLR